MNTSYGTVEPTANNLPESTQRLRCLGIDDHSEMGRTNEQGSQARFAGRLVDSSIGHACNRTFETPKRKEKIRE